MPMLRSTPPFGLFVASCLPRNLVILPILVSSFAVELRAQGPPASGAPSISEAARNRQPAFLVRADVNHANRDYRQGDTLSVRVASELDAYVYVLYQQADGKVFQIFPNVHQPDNRVPARQTVEIPGQDDAFRWSVGPPFGDETIKVIASQRPIAGLADPALRAGQFNAVEGKLLKGIELELGAEKPGRVDRARRQDSHISARPGACRSQCPAIRAVLRGRRLRLQFRVRAGLQRKVQAQPAGVWQRRTHAGRTAARSRRVERREGLHQ